MVETLIKLHRSILDRLGIGLSLLCLLHCLALPLFYILFPTVHEHSSEDLTHLAIALPVVLLAGIALKRGYAVHGNILPGLLGSSGSFFLVAALFQHGSGELLFNTISLHSLFTIVGSTLLVAGHIINMKSCCCGRRGCSEAEQSTPIEIGNRSEASLS